MEEGAGREGTHSVRTDTDEHGVLAGHAAASIGASRG